jgi:hypothetical protein
MKRAPLLLSLAILCLATSAQAQNFLLVPDSNNDRIMKLDPTNGAIISSSFIVDSNLQTPIEALPSGLGTILVSDQLLDEVREYDQLTGAFIRTLAGPAQGLDNIRGMAIQGNELFVTVASGVNAGKILRLDVATGNVLGTFADLNSVTAGASPFDVYFYGSEVLVSDSTGDDILRYDQSGNFLGKLLDSSNAGPINFPQQMAALGNGNIIVAGFSLPTALAEITPGGAVTTYASNTGSRGVYELGNGLVLYTGGTQIRTLDRSTNTHTVIFDQLVGPGLNAGSMRFVTLVVVPEPSTLALLALAPVLGFLRRRASPRRHLPAPCSATLFSH